MKGTDDIDPRVWKRAEDEPAWRCRRQAFALDLVLVTRSQRSYFGDPDLATCLLERALDVVKTLAVCVLPDRVSWLLESWPGRGAWASFLRQTEEYAEIYGAPEGQVWQRGFWYRPIRVEEEVAMRGREIEGLPAKEGLIASLGAWPAGVSGVEAPGACDLAKELGYPLNRARMDDPVFDARDLGCRPRSLR